MSLTLSALTNNKEIIQKALQTSPDHRLWQIIFLSNAFELFPGLVESIRHHADNGLATAQHMLGKMYLEGQGILKNAEEALFYCQLAASQGFSWGQYGLANAHTQGKLGLEKNLEEAQRLCNLASAQGLRPAQRLSIKIFDERKIKELFSELKKTEEIKWIQEQVDLFEALEVIEDLEHSIHKEPLDELSTLLAPLQDKYMKEEIDLSHLKEDELLIHAELNSLIYEGLEGTILPLLETLKSKVPTSIVEKKNQLFSRSLKDNSLSINHTAVASLHDADIEIVYKLLDVCNCLHGIAKKINEILHEKYKTVTDTGKEKDKDKGAEPEMDALKKDLERFRIIENFFLEYAGMKWIA